MKRAVETHRAAHQAFNKRDWKTLEGMCSPQMLFEDHPRAITLKSPSEFIDWLKEWSTGLSDAEVGDDVTYIDGGNYSTARFTGRGTHDGPMGPIAATGRRMSMPFCEVLHCDDEGKIVHGEIYYDQMTMLVQLGAIDPAVLG